MYRGPALFIISCFARPKKMPGCLQPHTEDTLYIRSLYGFPGTHVRQRLRQRSISLATDHPNAGLSPTHDFYGVLRNQDEPTDP